LNIVLITPEFVTEQYFSGGLANYINRVSKSLAGYGHNITIITPSSGKDETIEFDNITLCRLQQGKLKGWIDKLTRYKMLDTSKSLDFSFSAYKKIKQLKDTDIIQIPNYKACGIFTDFLIKKPTLLRISSYRPVWNLMAQENIKSLDTKVIAWLESKQITHAKNIIAPSQLLKDIIEKEEKLKQSIKVLRTPFFNETTEDDFSVYNEHLKETKYILYFGRYQLHKGFHILSRSLTKILEKHSDIKVVFVGDDSETSLARSMKQYAIEQNPKHKDKLIFINSLRHQQLYPIIKKAHFVVLPSLIDNMPNAALEAMALGKAVLGTYGASFDEFINDGQNGFLTKKDCIESLTTKLLEVLSLPNLVNVENKAKETIAEFEPDRVVVQLLEHYKSIIEKG
jgi:glycosyltransferase involved in cell wall biosynthesis